MPGFACLRGPTNRGKPLLSASGWLAAKRVDDRTDGLWRIHDNLYDLTSFQHPGGEFFINMSKGTDITELFESSHPNIEKARALLSKFLVRPVDPKQNPRNSSAFTFHEDGFYCTLRSRAWDILKQHGTGPTEDMLAFHDMLLVTFLLWLGALMLPQLDVHWGAIAFANGIVLSCLGTAAHNFFHQRDNWRMYCWDLTPYSSHEWRISHGYSHHVFPNCINDYEISAFQPYVEWLPVNKSLLYRCLQPVYTQLLFCVAMLIQGVSRWVSILLGKHPFLWEGLLPFVLVLLMASTRVVGLVVASGDVRIFTGDQLLGMLGGAAQEAAWRLLVVYLSCGWTFHNVSLAAGHHHPHVWHEGDAIPDSMDWGLFQLTSLADRPDVDASLYLSAVSYGTHTLHHLFPTVDHSKLHLLTGVFEQTCKEFIVTDGSSSDGSNSGRSGSAEAVCATRTFLSHRQLSISDGWWGFVMQAVRTLPSSTNAIFSFRTERVKAVPESVAAGKGDGAFDNGVEAPSAQAASRRKPKRGSNK